MFLLCEQPTSSLNKLLFIVIAFTVSQSLACSSKARINNSQVTQKKNELFGREKARQASLITRIEKIRVDHKGPPEECTLMMNKGLSTPFNCAMRK